MQPSRPTLFLLSLTLILQSCTKPSSDETLDPKQLFERYADAVVKVTIKQQGIPVSFGTGFFVSAEGHLFTNFHVLRNAMLDPGFTAEFLLKNGTKVNSFSTAGCSDDRNIDICLIQLPIKPSRWFDLATDTPTPGEKVYIIGHPRGYEWSFSDGIVSGLRNSDNNVREIQVTAPVSPGNSGGPIFGSKGELRGMTTWVRTDAQNLNFGIQNLELDRYFANHPQFRDPKLLRAEKFRHLGEVGLKLYNDEIEPAFSNLEKGLTPSLSTFRTIRYEFGGSLEKGYLPDRFNNCAQHVEGLQVLCFDKKYQAMFSIRSGKKEADWVRTVLAKQPLEPEPLELVSILKRQGVWPSYESKLTPNQRKFLFSVPREARCRDYRSDTFKSPVMSGSYVCHVGIYNDLLPNANAEVTFVQRGTDLLILKTWFADADLDRYYVALNGIFLQSSRPVQ